jgi:dinuclear metal center YbgI/SA1388 family protein
MERLAPTTAALSWDNVGLMLGDPSGPVKKILLALDCTDSAVNEAIDYHADLILTHHPLIFKPIKSITTETSLGRRIISLLNAHIAVYSAHTNLDVAEGGVNDELFNRLGLVDKAFLEPEDLTETGLFRLGRLEKPLTLAEFAKQTETALNITHIRFSGDPNRLIGSAATCCGGGSKPEYFKYAKQKHCDVYITGDITYHDYIAAAELDLSLIDATHYASEVVVLDKLRSYLADCAEKAGYELDIRIFKDENQVFNML